MPLWIVEHHLCVMRLPLDVDGIVKVDIENRSPGIFSYGLESAADHDETHVPVPLGKVEVFYDRIVQKPPE